MQLDRIIYSISYFNEWFHPHRRRITSGIFSGFIVVSIIFIAFLDRVDQSPLSKVYQNQLASIRSAQQQKSHLEARWAAINLMGHCSKEDSLAYCAAADLYEASCGCTDTIPIPVYVRILKRAADDMLVPVVDRFKGRYIKLKNNLRAFQEGTHLLEHTVQLPLEWHCVDELPATTIQIRDFHIKLDTNLRKFQKIAFPQMRQQFARFVQSDIDSVGADVEIEWIDDKENNKRLKLIGERFMETAYRNRIKNGLNFWVKQLRFDTIEFHTSISTIEYWQVEACDDLDMCLTCFDTENPNLEKAYADAFTVIP